MALSLAQLPTHIRAAPMQARDGGWRGASGHVRGAHTAARDGRGGIVLPLASQVFLLAAAGRRALRGPRGHRYRATVARKAAMMGPGWTDEIAQLVHPLPEGPKWQEKRPGYRGRPLIRLLLDGEDLVHSYAKAALERTGEWTGPVSSGLEKALTFGGWLGGAPDDPEAPEIMTFVGMPTDLVESTNPNTVVDGYPEDMRERAGRVMTGEDMEGYYVNEWIRQLQDQDRLITWTRPSTIRGRPRPNNLIKQKRYQDGEEIRMHNLRDSHVLLSQVMGAGTTLQVGETVEALKQTQLANGQWLPAKWTPAVVRAANYDGTYDLMFDMKRNEPYHRSLKQNLKSLPCISQKMDWFYKRYGADDMPAAFRLHQEMDFAMAVPPGHIRMQKTVDTIADTMDTDGSQSWYLVSNKEFIITGDYYKRHPEQKSPADRVEEWKDMFQIRFEWEDTPEGLKFVPQLTKRQWDCLQINHKDVVAVAGPAELPKELQIDEFHKKFLEETQEMMEKYTKGVHRVTQMTPDRPTRPAGPQPRPAAGTDDRWTGRMLTPAEPSLTGELQLGPD